MRDKAAELAFQQAIVRDLTEDGWQEGLAGNYERNLALYPEDLLAWFCETQPDAIERLTKFYQDRTEDMILKRAVEQMDKHGALQVLRRGFKDRGVKLNLCTFKPDHALNPETLARYGANRLRVVQEVSYSPHAHDGYNPRLDLVLFVNGVPVVTLELKSEFKQAIEKAKDQYRYDRPLKDPKSRKEEPLLAFKRRALVHFAVSQEEVWMTTRLAGKDTWFLPFNRGNNGAAGNPPNPDGYATDYLWKRVFQRDAFLNILQRFVHLEKKDGGREVLIFPRYHQWEAVTALVNAAREEGPGHRYLIQHSAGSGKSNSIAWTSHQLASLYDEQDLRIFDSIIVITDRTVLDSQLQETIYQIEHKDGVVVRVNREDGAGSKSEQLAQALEQSARIIIVTIQTFPFVLDLIRERTSLKDRRFAVIADEAHSSQTGTVAAKLRQVLTAEQIEDGAELSAEDVLDAVLSARGQTENISYLAFTATPKAKTLELFGRPANPNAPASDDNLPRAFHVYSMQQAIEEGFILDVLQRYTTYNTAFKLEQSLGAPDEEVDKSKGARKLYQWVDLHPYNIEQKVQVIVEHFRRHVATLLDGQAKAMVVTSSRKAAVRYKLAFDRYVKDQGYEGLEAMVAFSGEVNDRDSAPEPFTETNMNPGLKGREMRMAFDTPDYQVMIVANKFQTGFDQPKLCAMYVDKKLKGVDCVQTLSRLNRTYPGKEAPFVLDFVNEAEDVLDAFRPYYRTAELESVSDPNLVYDLQDALEQARLFRPEEVEAFAEAFFDPRQKPDRLNYHIRPAVDRYREAYRSALGAISEAEAAERRAKDRGDSYGEQEAARARKEAGEERDRLELFKKNLGSFVRFYEFISQVTELKDEDLEKLAVFCRHLLPLLRVERPDETIDLSGVDLAFYRLRKHEERRLELRDADDTTLEGAGGLGSGRPHEPEKEALSEIIARLNDLFGGDGFTDKDRVNYAHTIADKVMEDANVASQVYNNSDEQVMHGDFPSAVQNAVMDSLGRHQGMASEILRDDRLRVRFARLLLDLIRADLAPEQGRY